MTFEEGTKVGPYEILSHVGAGGQGEVYKARDTRLNRFVAIKVLPDALSRNTELRNRFEREAQTLASLSHPNICPVFDVGKYEGTDYLVMEFIEGETLSERLKSKRLPLDQSLRIAIEIADALDKAHRQRIAHRDVKPSNIMLTKTGAKLLDFGLAKVGLQSKAVSSVSHLPTDVGLTGQGTVLGTLQYMSPEQIEGHEADARSDIFGFGATLYEMVTGAKAFEGKSQVSLMASILEHEPRSITSLVPLTPPLLERVIRKCLAKDPNNRWQAASDLIEALEWIRGGNETTPQIAAAPVSTQSKTIAIGSVAMVAILAVIAAFLMFRKKSDTPLWVSLIPPESNFSASHPTLAVSPDGKRLIFSAPNSASVDSLWIRSIDSPDARQLPGTENGVLPFWSPDGQSIAFFNFSGGKLERLDIAGGTPQDLAPAANPRGGAWGPDGTIIFVPAPTSELMRVSSSGGTASQWNPHEAELQTFEAPHFLPDGKHFLFYVFRAGERQGLYAGSLDSTEVKRIPGIASKGEYANGFLFYCKGADLFAQPFDVSKLELTGEAKRVASNIGYDYGNTANRAFTVSAAGTLAYSSQATLATSQVTWFDRTGRQGDRIGEPGTYFGFDAAPDRKKVVIEKFDPGSGVIAVLLLDFSNGISSKLADGNSTPVWASDSEHVLYSANDGSIQSVSMNSGKKDTILSSSGTILNAYLQSVSPDRRYLVWTKTISGQSDPWIAPLDGSEKPKRFLETPHNEFRAQISPDGHWIAYVSNESGNDEVMVESFPQPGQRKRVSPDGGAFPQWRSDGRELYYLAPSSSQRRKLMAVKVESGPTFSPARPELLFETPPLNENPRRGQFAVFGNGDRFLMNTIVPETKPRTISLILNWPSLLK